MQDRASWRGDKLTRFVLHVAGSGLGWFITRRYIAGSQWALSRLDWFMRRMDVVGSGLGWFMSKRCVAGLGSGVDKTVLGQLVYEVRCWVRIRKVHEEKARCRVRGRLVCKEKVCC